MIMLLFESDSFVEIRNSRKHAYVPLSDGRDCYPL